MSTIQEGAESHAEARRLSDVNASAYAVAPEILEPVWLEEYEVEEDPNVIYFRGVAYHKED